MEKTNKTVAEKQSTVKWTLALRTSLYAELKRRFGPYKNWNGRNPAGYEDFCSAFAAVYGAKSWKAVDMQIRYAITHPKIRDTSRAHLHLLNQAAAFDANFITREEAFPSTQAEDYLFSPIAIEELVNRFYASLPHDEGEMSAWLLENCREAFRHHCVTDYDGRYRLTVATFGLLRLTLALHQAAEESGNPHEADAVKYDAIITVLKEVETALSDRMRKHFYGEI